MAPSSPPPDSFSEKRSFRRYKLWFPVTMLITDLGDAAALSGGASPLRKLGEEVWAICRDASASGLLVSSIHPLVIGTTVSARFKIAQYAAKERAIEATIARSETNDGELMLAFPFRLGLRFTSPIPELPEELADQIGVESVLPPAVQS